MGKVAVEVIQSVSDVRVLGAAAGVVAHAVVVGQATALTGIDRTILLQQLCNTPKVMVQLRRLLCFPGFAVRGSRNVGPSSTCGLSLEGCSFGIRSEGMLDGVLLLLFWGSGGTYFDLTAEATKQHHDMTATTTALQTTRTELLKAWINADFWSLLCRQLDVGGGGEISPLGCTIALSAMHALVQRSGKEGQACPEMLVVDETDSKRKRRDGGNGGNEENELLPLEVLVHLLQSEHLSKVFKWPVEFGGGAASHSPLMMATPIGLQMDISRKRLQQLDENQETNVVTNSQEARPFDWWSPGLVGVSGVLYRVILLVWSSIGEKVPNEVQRMAQQVRIFQCLTCVNVPVRHLCCC